MKMYLACGLTHVPRDVFSQHTNFLHRLASALRVHPPGHEVSYALVNSDPQLATKPVGERARLCYLWDREMVERADLVIAELSFPATGVGIELQIAQQKGTPIILCFRDFGRNRMPPIEYVNPDSSRHELQIGEGFITLMALGIPEVIRVVQYDTPEDGINKILDAVSLLEKP